MIEHLPDDLLLKYFIKCKSLLKPSGRVISLVPANQNYWCIEDQTAGHYRRFERSDFERLAKESGFQVIELSGLTFPLSNWLFPLANRLIERQESWKLGMTPEEQTLVSSTGVKQVSFKTVYPSYFRYLINEITMLPFHLLQMIFRNRPKSLILYCELGP